MGKRKVERERGEKINEYEMRERTWKSQSCRERKRWAVCEGGL